MRAAILQDYRKFELTTMERPQPRHDEVLVEVHNVGLCTSEYGKWAGKEVGFSPPFHAGHEFSGIVAEVGEGVTHVRPGERVTGYAEERCYADYVTLPGSWVIPLPADMPMIEGLGEPISCAVGGARRSGINLDDVVVIVGTGFMGLLLVQLLRLQGPYRLIAVDTRPHCLEHATRLGADLALSERNQVEQAVLDLTHGKGADIVVDASGNAGALRLCGDLLRYYGRLVIFSYHQGESTAVNLQQWNYKALDVINAHNRYPERFMDNMRIGLNYYSDGRLKLAGLVTHTFPLEEISDAFNTVDRKPDGFLKASITLK